MKQFNCVKTGYLHRRKKDMGQLKLVKSYKIY